MTHPKNEPAWPADFVPAAFVLNAKRLPRQTLPVRPTFFDGNGPDWVLGSGWAYDWDWTRLPVIARHPLTEKAYKDLGAYWKARGTKVWMTVVDPLANEEQDWLLLEGEVAAWVADDLTKAFLHPFGDGTHFMITEDGEMIASQGGAWSNGELLLSHQILPNGEEFRWPEWVTLMLSRHGETDWGNQIAQANGALSQGVDFYWFCVKFWRDYVFDQLQRGSDKAVAQAFETMELLDDMGYGPGVLNISVMDDLAMVYYADDPPAWIFRLWKVMNPLALWIDMTTEEGMAQRREMAMRRDSKYMKRRP